MRNLCLCILFLSPIFLNAQTWNWTATMGSPGSVSFDGFRVVRTDNAGNVYAMGRTIGTMHFGNDSISSTTGTETYVAKFDSNGNLLWVRQPLYSSNAGVMEGIDMQIDSSGHLYIGGYYSGQNLTFGSNTVSSTYGGDIFLLKCDTALNSIWIRTAQNIAIPQINSEQVQAITFDRWGRICVTGAYNNTTVIGTTTVTSLSTSRADIFVAVYEPNGNCDWVKNMNAQYDSYGTGIQTDSAGNIYISARHYGNLVCQGDTLFSPLANAWSHSISKLDSAGNLIWSKDVAHNFGGTYSNDLTLKDSLIYSTGDFAGSVTHNSTTYTANGGSDTYLAAVDLNGNVIWFEKSNFPGIDDADHIGHDSQGNIYVYGNFTKPIPWCSDTIWPVGYQPAQTWVDHFVLKTDSAGNFQWLLPTGSGANDFYIGNVHVGANDEVFTCGIFNGMILMDMTQYLPNGASDGYIGSIRNAPCCYADLNVPQNNILCKGDTLLLDAGAGWTSYLWSTGDTTQTISVTQEGLYAVQRGDSTSCVTASIPVFVNTKPDAVLSYTPLYPCLGDSVTLSAGPDYYWQYLWSDGQNVFTPGVTQPGLYWATVSDMNGCTGNTDTVNLVFSDPLAGFNVAPACAGQPTLFFDNSSYAPAWDSAYSWQWDFGSSPNNYSNLQNPSHVYTNSGTYNTQLIVITYNGCRDTVSIPVIVDTIPANVTITQNGTLLTSSSLLNNQWLLDGQAIPGATAQSYVATGNGNYSVVVTNACGSDTSNVILIDVGIDELQQSSAFTAYPNPAHDGVMIIADSPEENLVTVRIRDLQGRIVQEKTVSAEELQKGFYLPFEFATAGAYLLEVGKSQRLLVRE